MCYETSYQHAITTHKICKRRIPAAFIYIKHLLCPFRRYPTYIMETAGCFSAHIACKIINRCRFYAYCQQLLAEEIHRIHRNTVLCHCKIYSWALFFIVCCWLGHSTKKLTGCNCISYLDIHI